MMKQKNDPIGEVKMVNNRKKVPLRKCIGTGEMKPKKEMIRIVRSKEGEVSIDPTGKKSGRGAYLSLSEEAINAAKKKNSLSNHLEADVDSSIYEELLKLAAKENKSRP
ncbi:RNase P modulator RnpM [Pradoshia sp. D12]|uniref:RNase P modulator RnpM n=3 Tax=Bacillaceae TaxID=186817 RepID=UPI00298FB467|nr:YlxR family protein [Pradoshia sp. D12]